MLALRAQVNHLGSLNVLAACRANGVVKCVFSSSPSTRFTGADLDGVTEADLPPLPMRKYLQVRARRALLSIRGGARARARAAWHVSV